MMHTAGNRPRIHEAWWWLWLLIVVLLPSMVRNTVPASRRGCQTPARLLGLGVEKRIMPILLPLRGGSDVSSDAHGAPKPFDVDTWVSSSDEIIGEGTAKPGPHVTIEESILDKVRRAEVPTAGDEDVPFDEMEDIDLVDPTGTIEDQRKERDEYFAERPDLQIPVNETLLFEIRCQNLTCVRDMLAKGACSNFCTDENQSALHLACIDGDMAIVETLLDHGAIVNSVNDNLNTPLHIAAEFGHDDVIKLLVCRGANTSAGNM
jgi:hypothetical protein